MNRIAIYFAKELRQAGLYDAISRLNSYVGDIHNHCGISYGYGSIEDAIAFAEAQLDFFSVTGHFAWPDIDEDKEKKVPPDVVEYHREGFEKLRKNWPHYKECMKNSRILSFLSYEYHSFYYGDYTILCHSPDEDLPAEVAGDKDTRLTELLDGGEAQQTRFLCTPHHIGYRKGYRGINWDEFREAVSPVVEIISMHGAAESLESRLKYLHTMGPRNGRNTYQGGLGYGYHFGVVGSTDHHNAAPGSYGAGRTVLFAENLDRDTIWCSIRERRTSAASGDPIEAMLFVNGTRAGAVSEVHSGEVDIDAYVSSYDALEKVEIIQDGHVIAGQYDFHPSPEDVYEGTISFMFGWGKKHKPASWDIRMSVSEGTLENASPRLRGIDMVDPLDVPEDASSVLPSFSHEGNAVNLHVVTNGNPTAVTDATQGFVVDIEGSKETVINLSVDVMWNGSAIHRGYSITMQDIKEGSFTAYIDGFVSPAIEVGRFCRRGECLSHIKKKVKTDSQSAIYLRAYQKNGDALYTSPISFKK